MPTDRPIHTPTPFEIAEGAEYYLNDRHPAMPKRKSYTPAQVDEEIRAAFTVGAHWVVRRQLGTVVARPKGSG
jgi:hypothetical protein